MAVRVLVLLAASSAQAQSALEQARTSLKALELERAAAALKRCSIAAGLSRAEVLEFYELSGVVAALRGDAAGARRAFTELLVIAPGFKLHGRRPPKVTTPFAEAKANARERGPLTVSAEVETTEGPFITSLKVTTSSAAHGPVSRIKAELDEDGTLRTVVVDPGVAKTFPTRARSISVRLSALDGRNWVLFESETRSFKGPAVPELIPSPPPEPAPLAVRQPTVERAPVQPRLRPLAYGLLVAGGTALIGGVVTGLRSRDARTALDTPRLDDSGTVVSITRAQAINLNQQAVTFAIIADALFIGAGALTIGGVLTWLLGSVTPTTVAVNVTPGGLLAGISSTW